jgi:nicotinate (nicotinamide) nucleotide adenylyltransferase
MDFVRRAAALPSRLALFPGSFNPPTRAHLALARAALAHADELVFIVPRMFPHRPYEGASLEQRLEILRNASEAEPRFSVAATEGGLFIEIAEECRQVYGVDTDLLFLCGRDAAERIVNWDYGSAEEFARQLKVFQLLVAARQGEYTPPTHLAGRIRALRVPEDYSDVSSTEVRRRARSGEPWEHLVPPETVPLVRAML